jgi:hypothetical protein
MRLNEEEDNNTQKGMETEERLANTPWRLKKGGGAICEEAG